MIHKIKPLEDYIKINEDFYNPFDDSKVDTKPSHISDKGGLFKLRKEIFNINRVEYSKRPNGSYTVLARTQFSKGEIVEICPVIFVGPEAKTVPILKDIIFEINKESGRYGVVLGYGSIYRHNENPNITFAYNSKNRQMYFIAAKTIMPGSELFINYGKDYWMERSGFGLMAPHQENTTQPAKSSPEQEIEEGMSQVQPTAQDLSNQSITKQFSIPNSRANPVVSGIAIRGLGQQ